MCVCVCASCVRDWVIVNDGGILLAVEHVRTPIYQPSSQNEYHVENRCVLLLILRSHSLCSLLTLR